MVSMVRSQLPSKWNVSFEARISSIEGGERWSSSNIIDFPSRELASAWISENSDNPDIRNISEPYEVPDFGDT